MNHATPENTIVCTLCAYPRDEVPWTFQLLKQSAERQGIKLVVLCENEAYTTNVQGKVVRLRQLIEAFPAEIEYVLFVDGKDCLFCRTLEEICRRFNAQALPLLIGAETHVWPEQGDEWRGRFPQNGNGYDFHNSGMFMGQRQCLMSALAVLKWLHDNSSVVSTSDQRLWQKAALDMLIPCGLDHSCSLFMNVEVCDGVRMDAGSSTPKTQWGTLPCILHFPGPAVRVLPVYADYYGLVPSLNPFELLRCHRTMTILEVRPFRRSLAYALFPHAKTVGTQSSISDIATAPGDVFLYHMDNTFKPDWRLTLDARLKDLGKETVNASLGDISKRRLQGMCGSLGLPTLTAESHGDPNEVLFVKSNRNSGGGPDGLPPVGYRTARRKELATEWGDDDLVVEKFIDNGFYYRLLFCLGRMVVIKVTCDGPVKKMMSASSLETYTENNPNVLPIVIMANQVRDTSGMQYGCMDILEDKDGVRYVCDFGGTPMWPDGLKFTGELNSEGMLDYLRGDLCLSKC